MSSVIALAFHYTVGGFHLMLYSVCPFAGWLQWNFTGIFGLLWRRHGRECLLPSLLTLVAVVRSKKAACEHAVAPTQAILATRRTSTM